jgi:hypothetical protein
LSGAKAAKEYAKQQGVNIQYQTFFYERTPLAIIKMLPKVKAWHPDVIIGPRDSDNFLLLKSYFKDILVLSPYATAIDVAQMPSNFYSVTPSDSSSSLAIANMIEQNFPRRSIFSIVEIDCKSCNDVNKLTIQAYNKYHPDTKVISKYFIGDEAESLDISKLMNGYQKGQIILLSNRSVSSGILMMRITNYLKQKNTIFIGGDNWGSWKSGAPGRFKAFEDYIGFRVVPWSLDIDDKIFNQFKTFYIIQYHQLPPDHITYIIFTTILSIVEALQEYDVDHQKNMQERILKSYQKALTKDANWFRPKVYSIYKVGMQGEQYVGVVSTQQ